ncbi:ParB N-terminal domain-containing protein [Gluconacetobacter azotocaptans]|uniref:ParB N-terminal domain-containing protein n=1 Tax=Gluconacetobacter azotocaptans TaxID=142834 RepID=UPI00195A9663|nr:ParB N-terminal domain-containing protein [Gluconacetobacter azotocaptans]MBM9400342.1 ParB N-terminal domain-containing protein [Gluconacetobacter azotocaptans]
MNVVKIPISDIYTGSRLRGLDPAYVSLMASSFLDQGQRTAIEVRKLHVSEAMECGGKKYGLIAGAHRVAAAKKTGIETIFAIVKTANQIQAKLLEIDENLCRRELSPLDRATFLAERKEVYEQLHPETKNGGDRVSDQSESRFGLVSFTQETAERLGLTARSIEIAVARYRLIAPDVRVQLATTWVAESGRQLDLLAKLGPEDQRKVAQIVLQGGETRSVADIIKVVKGTPPPKVRDDYSAFLAVWKRASTADRGKIVEFLAPQFPGFVEARAA